MGHRRDVYGGDLRAGAASGSGRRTEPSIGGAGVWCLSQDDSEDADVLGSADYQRQLPIRRSNLRPARSNPSRCRQRRRFPVKQRHGIHQGALVEVSIPGGHGDRAVAGSHLHNLEVHALLNEPANKGVS